ncbi:MAG TPA: hypothetical protein VHG28_05795 [Longimicrobiaceae bacterium]|nr:hypothetical protein [Longimicrobiaceae bacterium]
MRRERAAGVETGATTDEWVPIGVFALTGEGEDFGEPLYLRMHRIRSGAQTITVPVLRAAQASRWLPGMFVHQ